MKIEQKRYETTCLVLISLYDLYPEKQQPNDKLRLVMYI